MNSLNSFDKCYYLWAREQVGLELKSHAAFVRSLQTHVGNRFLGILQALPPTEMARIWYSLLKQSHAVGSAAAGEAPSPTDHTAIANYKRLLDLSFAVVEPKSSDETPVSKREFHSAARSAIQNLLKVSPEDRGGRLVRFITHHQDCVVHTYLEGGSRYEQLCYWHNVFTADGNPIREWCSALQWLGISSQTSWSGVSKASLQDVIDAMMSAVKKFTEFCDTNV
jgi:hypothetical protein